MSTLVAAASSHVPVAQSLVGAQVMTFAIPVGVLAAVVLWGFFQRRRPLQ